MIESDSSHVGASPERKTKSRKQLLEVGIKGKRLAVNGLVKLEKANQQGMLRG